MKKLIMLAVAAMFSVSAAAYACDGKEHAKSEKAAKVAKKDGATKTAPAPKDQKKS